MDSAPPHPASAGQRLLAAIVFTDTVSFSARMQTDEVGTLAMLEKDFALMKATCEKYSGSVLKTTGDGLLLYFTSAVNAVTCAVKVQKVFAERKRSDPAADALTHRFGVHLGDVFMNNEDVMGDGVNIAARLQAQADPGGLCISGTVYDVVKNKISLEVEKLEGRELKNISEAITIYRVLLEAPKARLRPRAAAPAPAPKYTPPPAAPLFTGRQKFLIALGVIAAAALIGGWLWSSYRRTQDEIAESARARADLDRRLEQHVAEKSAEPVATIVPTAVKETDFAALLKQSGTPKAEADRAHAEALGLEQTLLDWSAGQMTRYTQNGALPVHSLPGQPAHDTDVYLDANHQLSFAEASGRVVLQRTWDSLKPAEKAAIVVSLFREAPEKPPAAIRHAADAFAYLHGLPAMEEALAQEK
ncbi:MAG TPA: adenylate/guanylate cyclase domain-containing protein [Candidatus Didemnitutus sp.]|nr:adenylate/guanylate cyclase domain-containing protein [Candidatus Didemnitutus sp.]